MLNKTISIFFILVCVWILNIDHAFAKDDLSANIAMELQKAKELYSQRENPECLKLAIEVYTNILKQIPERDQIYDKKSAEIMIGLSKCYFKMAAYYAKDNKEKALWFEKGEEYGRKGISLDPNNVGGYYWMAQNIGEHGSISKLYFMHKKSDFEEAIEKAEALDDPNEPYDYCGIYRTLAAYNTPRFLWGDLDKALEYAKKMESNLRCLSNKCLSNLSVLAELYWKVDKQKTKEYVKRIINADLSQFPETRFENSFEQKETIDKWGKLME